MTLQTNLACGTIVLLIFTIFLLMTFLVVQRHLIQVCSNMKMSKTMDDYDVENYFLLGVLQEREKNVYKINCGAVAISGFWALSTAFCMIHKDIKKTFLRSSTPYGIEESIIHNIDNIIFHEDYNKANYNNVALIKVSQSFLFEAITPVVVSLQPKVHNYAQIIGWQMNQLYKVQVIRVDTINTCSDYLNKTDNTTFSSICVTDSQLAESKCSLYPGSALITGRIILGFSHFGILCDQGNTGATFINVSKWYSWIYTQTCVNKAFL